MLTTFLGLVAASVLPTVSLILGSMTASGRSVKHITDLKGELGAAVDALFAMFGLVAVCFVVLLVLGVPTPPALASFVPLPGLLNRVGQAVVCAIGFLIVARSGAIPGIIRRSLQLRTEIAIDEARRKTAEKAPKPGTVAGGFKKAEGFGRVTSIDKLNPPVN